MNSPYYFATDGTHYVISDTGNNRVLIWNEMPMSFDQSADLVLGQPSFVVTTPNSTGINASSLFSPRGVAIYNGELLVADGGNARVLIWQAFPTSIDQAADFVLGQSSFTVNSGGTSQTIISNNLGAVTVDPSGAIYLADVGNSRVLFWSSIPGVNNAPATYVVGQTSFTNSAAVTSQSGLNAPWGVASNGNYLAIADTNGNRVSIYSLPLFGNGENASAVLGQVAFVGNSTGCTASTLFNPQAVSFRGNAVYVADSGNNRVMLWSDVTAISQYNQPAFNVFGQANFLNCGASTTQTSFSKPVGLFSDQWANLWVVDDLNNRLTVNPWQ